MNVAKRSAENSGDDKSGRASTPGANASCVEYVAPIAALVRKDFASNAFGNQMISTDEIVVGKLAVGRTGMLVVAAHPKPGSVPSEFDLIWVFECAPSSAVWKNTYLGPPPTCWEGVPESIADAVARTSGIPRCK